MSPSVGAKALKPNPTLRRLDFLIGDWRTEGGHPQLPGETLAGRTSFAWHEGGAFLIIRSQVDHPAFPDGVAIIGGDADSGTYAMTYFDERGVSRLLQVEVGRGEVSWRRDDAKLAQSLKITAKGQDTLVSRGRMSEHGGTWTDDLSQVFTRIVQGQ